MAKYENFPDEEEEDEDEVQVNKREAVSFKYRGKTVNLIISDFGAEMDLDRLTYIDLNNLVGEIITFPTILNRLGNMEALAADGLRDAELKKRVAEAQFKSALRGKPSPNQDAKGNDKGWTEGQVHDNWYASSTYRSSSIMVNRAQFKHELIKSAYWAAKSKSDKLDTLSTQLRIDDLQNIKSGIINGIEVKIARSLFNDKN